MPDILIRQLVTVVTSVESTTRVHKRTVHISCVVDDKSVVDGQWKIRADKTAPNSEQRLRRQFGGIRTKLQQAFNKVTKHMGRYVKRGRRDLSKLGFYDRTEMLDSELDAAILPTATYTYLRLKR